MGGRVLGVARGASRSRSRSVGAYPWPRSPPRVTRPARRTRKFISMLMKTAESRVEPARLGWPTMCSGRRREVAHARGVLWDEAGVLAVRRDRTAVSGEIRSDAFAV